MQTRICDWKADSVTGPQATLELWVRRGTEIPRPSVLLQIRPMTPLRDHKGHSDLNIARGPLPVSAIKMATIKCSLTIVPYHPSMTKSDQELVKADALSHAAFVTHSRRRARRSVMLSSSKPVKYRKSDRILVLDPWLGLVQHGNSDPFSSMSIEMTPQITSLLSTWASHVRSNEVAGTAWITEIEIRRDLQFEHNLHSRALVLLSCALVSTRNKDRKDLYIETLEAKRDCLKLMSSVVRQVRDFDRDLRLMTVYSYLFIAAAFLNEVDEARCHFKQLQILLESVKTFRAWSTMDELAAMCRVHHYDVKCALMHLRPPLLDARLIVDAILGKDNPVPKWKPLRNGSISTVTQPLYSQEIVELFEKLQGHVNYQAGTDTTASENSDLVSADLLWAVGAVYQFFDHWTFSRSQIKWEGDETIWRSESILSICALVFFACEPKGPIVANLRNIARKSAHALRRELEDARKTDVEKHWMDDSVRVWALYIGALWEFECGDAHSQDAWFTHELKKTVKEQDIGSYDKLRVIVDGFLKVPSRQEPGNIWMLGMTPYRARQETCHSYQVLQAALSS
jgi:hypothetical protein